MPNYKYTAVNSSGKLVNSTRRATDEQELHRLLRDEGLFLTDCKSLDKTKTFGKKLKAAEVADFCRQMGTLLGAGVTLVRALGILSQEEGITPRHKAMYESMLQELRRGNPLSYAMEGLGSVFPTLLINMIRSSEGTGSIDKTALRMADHYDKEHKLNQKVKSAMTYPIVVMVLGVLVLVFVMTFVIPQFETLFAEMPELPLPTRIVMGLSDLFVNHWMWLLVGLVALIFAVKTLKTLPAVRLALDKLKLRMPVFGKLNSKVVTARFARTLSSLYSSGMPIIKALQACKNTVGNTYIATQFNHAIELVRSGEPLSKSLEHINGLRRKLTASIYVGEETGSLDMMLNSTADGMDYEAELAVQKMMSMLEPMLLIVVAVMVGFIIIAVMLPIFNSYSIYGGDVGGM